MYFECHITMVGDYKLIQQLVEATDWSFSAINGDIMYGNGTKCYATRHYNMKKGIDKVLTSLHNVADALAQNGAEVIRRKVEIVLYDSKVKHGD